jgi:hypothetical protein
MAEESTAKRLLLNVDGQAEPGFINTIYESEAWRENVIGDVEFSRERRNLVVCLCTDGANPFKTGVQTWWPVLISLLNAPEYIRKQRDNMILTGLAGPREPNLAILLDILVDELYELYYKGVIMKYYTGEYFILRLKLLFSVGDYPGQNKIAGFCGHVHQFGCNKCLIRAYKDGTSALIFGGYRRYLPSGAPPRTDPAYGPPEYRDPPRLRTHAESVQDVGNGSAATGLKVLSPLARLKYFDLVLDVVSMQTTVL